MNRTRFFLPLYNNLIRRLSKGRGYGKNRFVRKILQFFDWMFRGEFVNVHGHLMHLPPKGFSAYSTSGIYGELDTITVESIVKKDDYVLDIGAAIGYYTLILRRAVGDSGKVFAFEPKQDRFQFLKENLKINKYENVEIENAAILPKNISPKFFKSLIISNLFSSLEAFAFLYITLTPKSLIFFFTNHLHNLSVKYGCSK